MTTLMIVDGRRGEESRSEGIARRIKGEIAQNGLSMVRAAGLVGMTQAKFSRRMTGNVDFGIAELDDICQKLGISFEYITSGIRAIPNGDGPDGGGVVRPKGFEPLTF
ncbi:helix-turn-helix domain-containing protein [Mycolicibacterium mucogenicum]|uniref:Helix-turn-helix transcriptional regulator n=1 Tax=Mycolicibacterium mucogenicum DSM 44124 TaxID=1226753 RepID=A0A8H2JI04_MYCMU|nr:helix-turn-helix transcriptional regulator [Mycolicibacterium mucogenicum]QPG69125.1 helix-turn-helix transcriptional regulator [Mycolicibacterium mucogenicum DSM 44124]